MAKCEGVHFKIYFFINQGNEMNASVPPITMKISDACTSLIISVL